MIVRMFNTYIYPFDEWRILILKLKASRDYFLFMEANKMKWSTVFIRQRLLNLSCLKRSAFKKKLY